MTDIAVVYTTGSERFRREMERELLEYYEEHAEDASGSTCCRDAPGGFCVYVAWQR